MHTSWSATPFTDIHTSRASLFQLFVASVRFPKDRSPLLFPTRSGVVERSIIENNVERV